MMDFSPLTVTFSFDGNLTLNSPFVTEDDDIIEGDEFFNISIIPGLNFVVGERSSAMVRIIDEESKCIGFPTGSNPCTTIILYNVMLRQLPLFKTKALKNFID